MSKSAEIGSRLPRTSFPLKVFVNREIRSSQKHEMVIVRWFAAGLMTSPTDIRRACAGSAPLLRLPRTPRAPHTALLRVCTHLHSVQRILESPYYKTQVRPNLGHTRTSESPLLFRSTERKSSNPCLRSPRMSRPDATRPAATSPPATGPLTPPPPAPRRRCTARRAAPGTTPRA